MQNEKYKEIQSLENQIASQQTISLNEEKMKGDVNIALNIINEVLTAKEITKKQILMLVDKLVIYEDGGLDIYLKGDLHKLCHNYFKVSENRANKIRKHLFDFIASHPDKFTKDQCTVYVKEQGVKVHYKIISKIINEEIGDMVELREMRHGYKLIKPIEDVRRVLLGNIDVGAIELFDHNNDKVSNNIVASGKRPFNYNNVISVITAIIDWVDGTKYKKHKF